MKNALSWELAIGVVLLMLLVFFPGSTPIRNTFSGQDKNAANQLRNSISFYFTEYGKLPGAAINSGDAGNYLEFQSDQSFMEHLLVSEDGGRKYSDKNPRGIPFFDDKRAIRNSEGKWRSGIADGALWDSRGNVFRIRLSPEVDGDVSSPIDNQALIGESALVWTAGKDGDFDTWKDNIRTW